MHVALCIQEICIKSHFNGKESLVDRKNEQMLLNKIFMSVNLAYMIILIVLFICLIVEIIFEIIIRARLDILNKKKCISNFYFVLILFEMVLYLAIFACLIEYIYLFVKFDMVSSHAFTCVQIYAASLVS